MRDIVTYSSTSKVNQATSAQSKLNSSCDYYNFQDSKDDQESVSSQDSGFSGNHILQNRSNSSLNSDSSGASHSSGKFDSEGKPTYTSYREFLDNYGKKKFNSVIPPTQTSENKTVKSEIFIPINEDKVDNSNNFIIKNNYKHEIGKPQLIAVVNCEKPKILQKPQFNPPIELNVNPSPLNQAFITKLNGSNAQSKIAAHINGSHSSQPQTQRLFVTEINGYNPPPPPPPPAMSDFSRETPSNSSLSHAKFINGSSPLPPAPMQAKFVAELNASNSSMQTKYPAHKNGSHNVTQRFLPNETNGYNPPPPPPPPVMSDFSHETPKIHHNIPSSQSKFSAHKNGSNSSQPVTETNGYNPPPPPPPPAMPDFSRETPKMHSYQITRPPNIPKVPKQADKLEVLKNSVIDEIKRKVSTDGHEPNLRKASYVPQNSYQITKNFARKLSQDNLIQNRHNDDAASPRNAQFSRELEQNVTKITTTPFQRSSIYNTMPKGWKQNANKDLKTLNSTQISNSSVNKLSNKEADPVTRILDNVNADKNDPNVKKMVYNTYRGLLGAYNNKANNMVSTLPRNMVIEDKGVSRQLNNMAMTGCLDQLNGRINPKEVE